MAYELHDMQRRFERAENALTELLTDGERSSRWEYVVEQFKRVASEAIKHWALQWVEQAEMLEVRKHIERANAHTAAQECMYCRRGVED